MDTIKDIAYAIGAIIALALLLYGAKLAIAFFYSKGPLL